MSLRLDKDKGVNPKLTFCRRCGGEGEASELVLIGANRFKYTCPESTCGAVHYGRPDHGKCATCGHAFGRHWEKQEIGDNERLPAQEPCDDCQAELKQFAEEVAKGGVYWKCTDCPATGVVKASAELAIAIRKDHPAPDPIGVEFSAENCPECNGNAGEDDGAG